MRKILFDASVYIEFRAFSWLSARGVISP